jgi:hypothetical protein
MYAHSSGKLTDAEVEKDYLRFTEISGSIAYAMMLLLAPATFMFLRLEYNQSFTLSLTVSILIAVGGFIMLLTNAASLSKYEARKTSVVLQDIRSSNLYVDVGKIEKQYNEKVLARKFPGKKITVTRNTASIQNEGAQSPGTPASPVNQQISRIRWTRRSWSLSGIIIVAFLVMLFAGIGTNARITEENTMTGMTIIGTTDNLTSNNLGIPTMEIAVTKGTGILADQAKNMLVKIKDVPKISAPMTYEPDLIKGITLPDNIKPKWQLIVNLFDAANVSNGDPIYINVLFSFHDASGGVITPDQISEGEWLFPIVVTVGDTKYVLAQVHVKITSSASTPASPDKSASTKSQLDIHIV